MSNVTRRQFLGASAAAAAGLAAAPALADDKKPVSANDKVRVALIGCGGMGRANLRDFIRLDDFVVTALCDPDPRQIEGAMGDLKKAGRPTEKVRTDKDFRKILESKDLDAVIVGTPDHWHAYVLIAACASGKDVYCEKPLSHNIVEGRKMVEAARRNKRVVQIGTQQRSGKHFQDAVKYVQDGKLGTVTLCRTWITNHTRPDQFGNPPDGEPPAGVDYDLWLGPAPKRPFNPNRFHHNFRWFWDYGNGLCNDWGVHLNDIILWGMKVRAPLAVYDCGGKYEMKDNSDTPDTLDVHYTYPGFTHVYTVRQGVYHYGPEFADRARHGMEFHGSKGVLHLHRGGWMVTAEGERQKPEQHPGSEQHFAHVKDFLACVRSRGRTASDIEDMHRATTTCHLANISYKLKRRVWWDAEHERCYRGYDPEAKKFLGEDAEANAYLLREPRKPWSLTL
ncbi:MAG TPA: Gfo/Idh/MocA family oxidoreductase [Gemmataceae bacterium]|nr:Gfo/Idh/MocA family oxidoreductase [Gemmataceae bacterium]